MIKMIGLMKRRDGMPVEEYQAYWRDVHAPFIAATPGLRRYVQTHPIVELYDTHPPAYDGMAEAWFDDLESMAAAQASAEWQAAVKDAPNFMGPSVRVFATETPIIGALESAREQQSLVKYVGLLTRRNEGMDIAAFQSHWRDVHGPLVTGEFPAIRRYIQCHPLPETYGTDRHPAYDGVPEAWFDSLDVFPWVMLRRAEGDRNTEAALDSASLFQQPIPFMLGREVVILD